MSHKEQAEKLVDKFYKRYAATDTCFGICENNSDICDGTGHGCGLWKQYARESAIICVEQIITELENLYVISGSSAISDRHMYYKLVKQEIESIKQ